MMIRITSENLFNLWPFTFSNVACLVFYFYFCDSCDMQVINCTVNARFPPEYQLKFENASGLWYGFV